MRDIRPNQIEPDIRLATSTSGMCSGALVMTTDGEIPVEHLTAGDRLITRGGAVILRDVIAREEVIYPIRIKASSLGHNRPGHDALVTMSACINLRDWRAQALYGVAEARVAAGRLVDGEFLTVEPARGMVVYDLVLDEDQIIYADGIEMLARAA